ncbi:50S ribosomal protein L21 [Buchnera aphidicola str. Bp (Baizongia pistaciae)]|uniref:Large ribosomal subunit protein bL21 n=1 Tax=Buchnera aphidicola subsp. Baizongia pistaciae (strain Bp) TaxID=224915 RepID=RL21_BUCBP|nr:50S ribosomal protein L21 [Buchnera aphidicola]Q89AE8.1 RecName: Full=Large ribosomal subunit protein bL21; AltName: Full=50S ribosomal protein L21 [Buchnera aphidicola str. Bp (Baizongia pistaciae)]AAO27069.1 50S ribosomal protein L21 [Buchnera aphidicola str. Bp (Baizongia pistaciae)]
MYAIFKSGGKQHKVIKGQTIRLEKINQSIGTQIKFKKILMCCNGTHITIGKPHIHNNFILANIINHGRHKKIKIIKFNRRKHYKKQQGHRQNFTDVLITNIHNNYREQNNGS